MKLRLELSRLLLYHATALKVEVAGSLLEAAMTKLFLSESYLQKAST